MAERSRDRSSSTELQPKFPECPHFRRRNDNHRRCQQCRLNDGQPLCTQDRPCLFCKDWLPEAWTAQAKATAQKNRRKAAATAKAAKKASETMDDSVELHAPEDALQTPSKRTKVQRFVQGQAVENSHKFLSTQVRGFKCLGGGTAQLPRVGPPQV